MSDEDPTGENDFDEGKSAPKSQKQVPSPKAPVGDIPLDEFLEKQAKKKKAIEFTKDPKKIMYGGLGAFILLLILMMFSCQGQQGSVQYGVCSVFLEMNTPYPHTLNFTDVIDGANSVRIYFNSVDPFGEFKFETLECRFETDKAGQLRLAAVQRNRREWARDEIARFNKQIPLILQGDLETTLPPFWVNPLLQDGGPMYQGHEVPIF